eukprot:scaffold12820_cov129-Isochrysis_galbana.AAC.2
MHACAHATDRQAPACMPVHKHWCAAASESWDWHVSRQYDEAGYLPAPPPLRASDCGHAAAVETVHCDSLAYTRRVRPAVSFLRSRDERADLARCSTDSSMRMSMVAIATHARAKTCGQHATTRRMAHGTHASTCARTSTGWHWHAAAAEKL